MKEVLDNLKCNATNGKESFCMISEKQLNAMKELVKRDEELKQKQDTIDKVRAILKECLMLFPHEFDWEEQANNILSILGDK